MTYDDPIQKSILSDRPDGCNFFYGFAPDDHRQINVRWETPIGGDLAIGWAAYVGGEKIGVYNKLLAAEAAALKWMKEHPVVEAKE